jgi:ribokinase
VAGEEVVVVDTTGAGDAFCGALGFYVATAPQLTLMEAMARAVAVAGVVVTNKGTQKSYPFRDQLPARLF